MKFYSEPLICTVQGSGMIRGPSKIFTVFLYLCIWIYIHIHPYEYIHMDVYAIARSQSAVCRHLEQFFPEGLRLRAVWGFHCAICIKSISKILLLEMPMIEPVQCRSKHSTCIWLNWSFFVLYSSTKLEQQSLRYFSLVWSFSWDTPTSAWTFWSCSFPSSHVFESTVEYSCA